jgi:hypothetical protein
VNDIVAALEALRDAVAGGERDAVDRAAADEAFTSADVAAVPGGDEPAHVSVAPAGELTVDQLEELLGPARRLPRSPAIGSPRTVLFERTMPEEGSAGATVLAEVDDDDRVSRLIVRADRF